jgi:CheY-like chemotaxis protein
MRYLWVWRSWRVTAFVGCSPSNQSTVQTLSISSDVCHTLSKAKGKKLSDRTKRILVVEDDALVAADIADLLCTANYEVVGPAGVVADALHLVKTEGCDAAILDINLGKTTSEPIASALRDREIPFMVLSGYAAHQQPAVFDGVPRLTKPVDTSLLLNSLAQLTAAKHSGR